MKYDFHQQLEWMEFQNLARDVIQIREGVLFESFKEGKDNGIDGRFCSAEGTIILQAKRYGNYKALKLALCDEWEKVRKLRPERYILVVSLQLTEGQKSELMKTFRGHIKLAGDLVSGDDLNNYLSQPQYRDVVRNYPKLWAASGVVLQELVRETVNNSVVQESKRQLALAKEASRTFVATHIYNKAMDILDKQNCIIVSGQPGAGKSTLAQILALYYLEHMRFEEFIWVTSSVEKLMDLYLPDRKQVFVIDDIWGQVFFAERKHDQEMGCLKQFLRYISNDKKKIFIITTREYIYQQATAKYPDIRSIIDRFKLICEVEAYADSEKAKILFSHIHNANLDSRYIWPIYYQIEQIVKMSDFSPRVIDLFLQNNNPWDDSPDEFAKRFIENLRHPFTFWEEVFYKISEEAKLVALFAFISQGEVEPVGMKGLENSYYYCLEHMKHPPESKRNFYACISELEKTFIRVSNYYTNSNEKVVYFRTPTVQDFLLKFLRENVGCYGPILLDGVCYLNQLVFLMDDDKIHLPDRLYEKALHMFIEHIETWDFLWPFEVIENCIGEGEEIKDSILYRCLLLQQIHKKRPRSESYLFLRSTIMRYRLMLKNCEELTYFDMVEYPFFLRGCKEIGVVFENEEEIVDEYFQRCFLALHYYAICDFGNEFADSVNRILKQSKKWFQANLEGIIWDTIDYFELHGMDGQLDIMLEIRLPSVFDFLGVRYTQRFYKELGDELERHICMPFSLQKKHELQPTHQCEEWEDSKKTMNQEEKQLCQAIDQEWERIWQNSGSFSEERQQIEAIMHGTFSPNIKKQLRKMLKDMKPSSMACFLESRNGLKLLESILRSVTELPKTESDFLNKVADFFSASCYCDIGTICVVLWRLIQLESESSLERYVPKQKIAIIMEERDCLSTLNFLQEHGMIKMSEKIVHFKQMFPAHLLLAQQIISVTQVCEKAVLYKNLRKEGVWNNIEFMFLVIPLLAELDTESFNRYYLGSIMQEFEDENMEERKQPLRFFERLGMELTFPENNKESCGLSMSSHELLIVLDCLNLYSVLEDFIPPHLIEKLDTLPFVKGFELKDNKYLIKLELLDEHYKRLWGFAETSAAFFSLLEKIKKYMASTAYKKQVSPENIRSLA